MMHATHIPIDSDNCTGVSREMIGREALEQLIAGLRVTRHQIQSFRDLLPVGVDGAAGQGLRCLTQACLHDIEQDIAGLKVVEENLTELLQALPLKFPNERADAALRTLLNSYQYRLSRRFQ